MASVLENAVFGPGAFQRYYEAQGLGGRLGFVDNIGDEVRDQFGEVVSPESVLAHDERFRLTGEGLDEFSDKEGMLNESTIKVVGDVEGGYLVMAKSGDKTGNVYAVMERPDGKYQTAGLVKENVPFETNSPWWKENIGILQVAAAPFLWYAGQVVQGAIQSVVQGGFTSLSAALDAGFAAASNAVAGGVGVSGSAAFQGAGEVFSVGQGLGGLADIAGSAADYGTNWTRNITPDYASGAAPGESAGRFTGNAAYAPTYTEAYDAGQLLAQGLSPEAAIQNLVGTGLDEMVAADIVQLVQQGLPETQIMDIITQQYPPNMQNPGMPNTVPPPGAPGSPNASPPPAPPNSGPPAPPGTPPTQPGPGGNSPTGGADPLSSLLALLDSYNKYASGKDIMDFAKRIYGKADWFEDQLQQTYQNPDYYFNSPEFQSLSRITSNQLRRRDAKEGILSNDTRFGRDFYDRSLQAGLTPHRAGLVSAANLGKQNSATALKGFGEGLNQRNSALSPLTFNAGNQAGNAVNQTNQFLSNLTQVGGSLRDLWNWAGNFFGN